MHKNIAILGWGSLLWDNNAEFDQHHGDWSSNGPELAIEFSRISKTRNGALTLVIDPKNGTACKVAYATSRRLVPNDAIADLRHREGTVLQNIGYHFADGSGSQSKDAGTLATITGWAAENEIDVVIWTDLKSNFEEIYGRPFSTLHAMEYFRTLDSSALPGAVEYIRRAPDFVVTPLRTAIQSESALR